MATAVKSIKTDSISPIKINATAGKAFDIFRYISGYYEEVDDEQSEELNKDCGISVNIKRNYTKLRQCYELLHSGRRLPG